MSFAVYLGNNNKRFNSTRQADWSGEWYKTEATWKSSLDILRPTIELYLPDLSQYPQWNQFYIEEVSSFYWITSITSVRKDVWVVSGMMDCMATYRDAILATKAYIEYGNNTPDPTGKESRVADPRIPISMVPTIQSNESDVWGGKFSATGSYLLTVQGSEGSSDIWLVTLDQISEIVDSMPRIVKQQLANALEEGDDLDTFLTTQGLSFGDVSSTIKNCKWVPIPSSEILTKAEAYISLCGYSTGVKAKKVAPDSTFKIEFEKITIPWQAEDWKRMNHQIQLYIPFIGMVDIPVSQANNVDSINCRWSVSVVTGDASVRVEIENGLTIYTGTCNLGLDYPIGSLVVPLQNVLNGQMQMASAKYGKLTSITSGVAGLTNSASAVAEGAMTDNAFKTASGLASGVNAIAQGVVGFKLSEQKETLGAVQSVTPIAQCTGAYTASSVFGQSKKYRIVSYYYPPIEEAEFRALYGHPVYRVATPVAGYCQTQNFILSGNQRAEEKSMVSQIMNSGAYIE